jgi:hypothetical protein
MPTPREIISVVKVIVDILSAACTIIEKVLSKGKI